LSCRSRCAISSVSCLAPNSISLRLGRIEVTVASRVRVEEGAHGPRLVADPADPLTTDQVRRIIERGRPAL
jgi:hypothetical protein